MTKILTVAEGTTDLLQAFHLIKEGKRTRVSFDTKLFAYKVTLAKKGTGVHFMVKDSARGIVTFSTMIFNLQAMEDLAHIYFMYNWRNQFV